MLSFATEFPINIAKTSVDFVDAVKAWIVASPHTNFTEETFASFPSAGNWSAQAGNEKIEALLVSHQETESVAIRYSRSDGEIAWETTTVFSRSSSDAWVSVRTARESTHPAVQLPLAKKPVLVRTLLERLGGGHDGRLLVTDKPRSLRNSEIGLAASLLTGEAGCHLPVVYVSCAFDGSYIIEPRTLANELAGIAHIVIEPNRPFSRRLQIEVNSENVYGGVIGIYWPNGQGRRSLFLNRDYGNPIYLKRAIAEEVRAALTNRRPLLKCTWSSVEETSSRLTIDALNASGSVAVEEYVAAFGGELKAKQEQIEDAEKEIARLRAEVRKYESNPSLNQGVILQTGQERDLYAKEILQIILEAIRDAKERAVDGSRRAHVLQAILSNNSMTTTSEGIRESLKTLLRGYRNMDAKIKRGLEDLGFSISEDGKHHKLVFQDDDRYSFALSKSGSDHRGGLNAASDIAKKIL